MAVLTNLDAKKILRSKADLQRPWLHHLNADTSWLLQLPRGNDGSGHPFHNILIDPWFDGPTIEGHALFHWQAHATPSAVRTISELEEFLQDTEDVARQLSCSLMPGPTGGESSADKSSLLDAVLVLSDATDHCNKNTLMQISPDVPCYALKRSANMIGCWKHFESLTTIPFRTTSSNWQDATVDIVSGRISVAGLKQPGDKNRVQLFYGLLITFELQSHQRDSPMSDECGSGPQQRHSSTPGMPVREAIAYLPHGICPNNISHMATPNPPLRYLALMSCLHLVNFGIPFGGWNFDSNLGAHSALQTLRLLNAKYWLGTHDEIKQKGGFTSLLEWRQKLTFEDALRHSLEPEEVATAPIGTDWLELGNGESKLLLQ